MRAKSAIYDFLVLNGENTDLCCSALRTSLPRMSPISMLPKVVPLLLTVWHTPVCFYDKEIWILTDFVWCQWQTGYWLWMPRAPWMEKVSKYLDRRNLTVSHIARRPHPEQKSQTAYTGWICSAQYTPPTPTRQNSFVASASVVCRPIEHNSQLAHDECRRIRSTIWKLAKQTPFDYVNFDRYW